MQKKILCIFPILMILFIALSGSAYAVPYPTLNRLAGEDRYETACQIAKAGWEQSDYVILAYGGNFPDALVSTPLAAKYNAPILLTDSKTLTPVTKDTLGILGVKNVIIVGGTGVVSSNVENSIKDLGISTIRLAGLDRYDTSVLIADKIDNPKNKIIVTTGDNFPNALSISSYAGHEQIPILLVGKNSMSDSLSKYLNSHNISQTFIIGNSNEISDSTANLFPNVTRIQGNDRYETNLAVIKAFEEVFNFNNAFIATGTNFADALAGSAYAARLGAPIFLTDKTTNSQLAIYFSVIQSKISKLNILGGDSVVPNTIINTYFNTTNASISAREIFSSISPSVVYIETYDQFESFLAGGSGFVVDSNGKILTNFHLIDGAYSAKVTMDDGTVYNVSKVLAYDIDNDIAVLRINVTGLKAVILGDSDLINTGDKIYTIGNPFGLENTISDGLISSKSRTIGKGTYIQISAPISSGSSGGVLLNEQALVIGVTSLGIDGGQNLNFAIPINLVKPLLSQDVDKTLAQVVKDTSANKEKIPYIVFEKYLYLKYGLSIINHEIMSYVISFSSVQVKEENDSLSIALNLNNQDDFKWLWLKVANPKAIEFYIHTILDEAEAAYPEFIGHISVSAWLNGVYNSQPSGFPENEITYDGNNVWYVRHCRAYADDFSGNKSFELDPSK